MGNRGKKSSKSKPLKKKTSFKTKGSFSKTTTKKRKLKYTPKLYCIAKKTSRPARSGKHVAKKANGSEIRHYLRISRGDSRAALKVVESLASEKSKK